MICRGNGAVGAALATILAVSCGGLLGAGSAQGQTPFYSAAAEELPGRPGTLIRKEPIVGAPLGAQAYRVLYRSTGLNGQPIAVSGLVIVPPGPAPVGGRHVVAWAHPTTGIVPSCAPSLALFKFQQIQGLRDMVARGYIVAATDYPGLGPVGPHPDLVGVSEGRAVLDAVRAARNLVETGTLHRFAAWGHSQGGQAVLYAATLASAYAPELELTGVAAAAPATAIGTLMRDDLATPGGKNLLAMTLWSWSRVFGSPIESVVDAAAMPTINRLAQICLESPIDIEPRRRAGAALQRRFLKVDNLTDIEPWRSLLAQNTVGALPASIPVFVAQGAADGTVVPSVTRNYVRQLCSAGSKVRMLTMPGIGHGTIAMRSSRIAIAWIADRFAGRTAPDDCGS